MKLYCYHIPPIDYWFGALTDQQLLSTAWDSRDHDWEALSKDCQRVADLKKQAVAAFAMIDWEGDISVGPYYFALPGDTDLSIGLVVKQSNNGNCFVASPEPLPFLDGLAIKKVVVGQ